MSGNDRYDDTESLYSAHNTKFSINDLDEDTESPTQDGNVYVYIENNQPQNSQHTGSSWICSWRNIVKGFVSIAAIAGAGALTMAYRSQGSNSHSNNGYWRQNESRYDYYRILHENSSRYDYYRILHENSCSTISPPYFTCIDNNPSRLTYTDEYAPKLTVLIANLSYVGTHGQNIKFEPTSNQWKRHATKYTETLSSDNKTSHEKTAVIAEGLGTDVLKIAENKTNDLIETENTTNDLTDKITNINADAYLLKAFYTEINNGSENYTYDNVIMTVQEYAVSIDTNATDPSGNTTTSSDYSMKIYNIESYNKTSDTKITWNSEQDVNSDLNKEKAKSLTNKARNQLTENIKDLIKTYTVTYTTEEGQVTFYLNSVNSDNKSSKLEIPKDKMDVQINENKISFEDTNGELRTMELNIFEKALEKVIKDTVTDNIDTYLNIDNLQDKIEKTISETNCQSNKAYVKCPVTITLNASFNTTSLWSTIKTEILKFCTSNEDKCTKTEPEPEQPEPEQPEPEQPEPGSEPEPGPEPEPEPGPKDDTPEHNGSEHNWPWSQVLTYIVCGVVGGVVVGGVVGVLALICYKKSHHSDQVVPDPTTLNQVDPDTPNLNQVAQDLPNLNDVNQGILCWLPFKAANKPTSPSTGFYNGETTKIHNTTPEFDLTGLQNMISQRLIELKISPLKYVNLSNSGSNDNNTSQHPLIVTLDVPAIKDETNSYNYAEAKENVFTITNERFRDNIWDYTNGQFSVTSALISIVHDNCSKEYQEKLQKEFLARKINKLGNKIKMETLMKTFILQYAALNNRKEDQQLDSITDQQLNSITDQELITKFLENAKSYLESYNKYNDDACTELKKAFSEVVTLSVDPNMNESYIWKHDTKPDEYITTDEKILNLAKGNRAKNAYNFVYTLIKTQTSVDPNYCSKEDIKTKINDTFEAIEKDSMENTRLSYLRSRLITHDAAMSMIDYRTKVWNSINHNLKNSEVKSLTKIIKNELSLKNKELWLKNWVQHDMTSRLMTQERLLANLKDNNNNLQNLENNIQGQIDSLKEQIQTTKKDIENINKDIENINKDIKNIKNIKSSINNIKENKANANDINTCINYLKGILNSDKYQGVSDSDVEEVKSLMTNNVNWGVTDLGEYGNIENTGGLYVYQDGHFDMGDKKEELMNAYHKIKINQLINNLPLVLNPENYQSYKTAFIKNVNSKFIDSLSKHFTDDTCLKEIKGYKKATNPVTVKDIETRIKHLQDILNSDKYQGVSNSDVEEVKSLMTNNVNWGVTHLGAYGNIENTGGLYVYQDGHFDMGDKKEELMNAYHKIKINQLIKIYQLITNLQQPNNDTNAEDIETCISYLQDILNSDKQGVSDSDVEKVKSLMNNLQLILNLENYQINKTKFINNGDSRAIESTYDQFNNDMSSKSQTDEYKYIQRLFIELMMRRSEKNTDLNTLPEQTQNTHQKTQSETIQKILTNQKGEPYEKMNAMKIVFSDEFMQNVHNNIAEIKENFPQCQELKNFHKMMLSNENEDNNQLFYISPTCYVTLEKLLNVWKTTADLDSWHNFDLNAEDYTKQPITIKNIDIRTLTPLIQNKELQEKYSEMFDAQQKMHTNYTTLYEFQASLNQAMNTIKDTITTININVQDAQPNPPRYAKETIANISNAMTAQEQANNMTNQRQTEDHKTCYAKIYFLYQALYEMYTAVSETFKNATEKRKNLKSASNDDEALDKIQELNELLLKINVCSTETSTLGQAETPVVDGENQPDIQIQVPEGNQGTNMYQPDKEKIKAIIRHTIFEPVIQNQPDIRTENLEAWSKTLNDLIAKLTENNSQSNQSNTIETKETASEKLEKIYITMKGSLQKVTNQNNDATVQIVS